MATASCGKKKYGILAVMLQLFCSPEHLFDIPPEAFSPAPKCTVAVVHFTPDATPAGREAPLSKRERERLMALLKLVFEQRRKMLRHTLKPLLEQAVIPPPAAMLQMRPEQLSPSDFLDLAAMVFGEGTAEGELDDAVLRIAGAHKGDGWSPRKSGWDARANGRRV